MLICPETQFMDLNILPKLAEQWVSAPVCFSLIRNPCLIKTGRDHLEKKSFTFNKPVYSEKNILKQIPNCVSSTTAVQEATASPLQWQIQQLFLYWTTEVQYCPTLFFNKGRKRKYKDKNAVIIICCELCWEEVPAEGVLTVHVVIRYRSRQLLLLRLWSRRETLLLTPCFRRQLKIILKTVFVAL